jgi:signal peptidase II
MRARPVWSVFLGLAAAIVIVDQLVKAWIVSTIDPGERIEVMGDLVRLIHTQNSGAVFGLFRENALLFGALSIAVVGLIVLYHGRSPRSLFLSTTLGLLLGGAVGNLIDRLRLGHVVDFVDAGIGGLRFYTFNVADAAISASILLLIVLAFRPSLAGSPPGGAAIGTGARVGGGSDADAARPDAARPDAAEPEGPA